MPFIGIRKPKSFSQLTVSIVHRIVEFQFIIPSGIDVTANRLFGPQPRTATYVCIWEVHLGHVKAIISASDGRILAAAGQAFRLNFADLPNAPAVEYLPVIERDGMFQFFVCKSFFLMEKSSHVSQSFTPCTGCNLASGTCGVDVILSQWFKY
jgi:hypothetical protein